MASRLQDVIQRGVAAGRPAPTSVAPATLYFSTDTLVLERSNGTAWESYSGVSGGGGLHASTHATGGTDPVILSQGQVTGLTTSLAGKVDVSDGRLVNARTPTAHGSTHAAGGSDSLLITGLAGFPGGTTTYLRADGTFAASPSVPVRVGVIEIIIDGGASPISTGLKAILEIPFLCYIQGVTLLADVVGSIVIDIWKSTYASYPPTVLNTILSGAKPSISAAIKSQNFTLTGWDIAISPGDILAFNVDMASVVKRVTLSLNVQSP
jgi:hypothetical protein